MKNILHLFKRDVQNVSRSVIGLVVVMGLIIVPCLYAWFNIAGSWDPYGNTGNLKIAVVNTDEGYESDLIPVEVNVGENVTATLRGNESFDWVVLNNREKAIEGVKSGAYYAAVVIPKSFSSDMMTLFSTDVKHADIEFYENQKANAIAQIVTEKGSSAVQSQVNKTFTETITTIGLKTVSSLLDYMSTDQVGNFIANLSSTLGDSIEDLRDVRANASSLAGILSSTSDSLTSASGMLKQTGTVDESTKQLMEHVKSGIDDSREALKAATMPSMPQSMEVRVRSTMCLPSSRRRSTPQTSMWTLRCPSSTMPRGSQCARQGYRCDGRSAPQPCRPGER